MITAAPALTNSSRLRPMPMVRLPARFTIAALNAESKRMETI
jgi:hypothetical protein